MSKVEGINPIDHPLISSAATSSCRCLNYEQYGVLSTDLGWWTSVFLVNLYPDSVIGHCSDFWIAQPAAEYL
jgi:hypothetical protein